MNTPQDTIILTVQKCTHLSNDECRDINDKFVIRFSNNNTMAFNTIENIITLKLLHQGSRSLASMGITASIGTVVWNQSKLILTDDPTCTRLIYNSNIKDGHLIDMVFKDTSKKSYIHSDGEHGPIMVINRGYGAGKYTFNHCLINISDPYLIENHLICIKCPLHMDNILETYRLLEQSLSDKKTTDFVNLYFRNNAINCSELVHVLPIYI